MPLIYLKQTTETKWDKHNAGLVYHKAADNAEDGISCLVACEKTAIEDWDIYKDALNEARTALYHYTLTLSAMFSQNISDSNRRVSYFYPTQDILKRPVLASNDSHLLYIKYTDRGAAITPSFTPCSFEIDPVAPDKIQVIMSNQVLPHAEVAFRCLFQNAMDELTIAQNVAHYLKEPNSQASILVVVQTIDLNHPLLLLFYESNHPQPEVITKCVHSIYRNKYQHKYKMRDQHDAAYNEPFIQTQLFNHIRFSVMDESKKQKVLEELTEFIVTHQTSEAHDNFKKIYLDIANQLPGAPSALYHWTALALFTASLAVIIVGVTLGVVLSFAFFALIAIGILMSAAAFQLAYAGSREGLSQIMCEFAEGLDNDNTSCNDCSPT